MIGYRRDGVAAKALTGARDNRHLSSPTVGASCLVIRAQPHLVTPVNYCPQFLGLAADGGAKRETEGRPRRLALSARRPSRCRSFIQRFTLPRATPNTSAAFVCFILNPAVESGVFQSS
jgi:hypothetical protein